MLPKIWSQNVENGYGNKCCNWICSMSCIHMIWKHQRKFITCSLEWFRSLPKYDCFTAFLLQNLVQNWVQVLISISTQISDKDAIFFCFQGMLHVLAFVVICSANICILWQSAKNSYYFAISTIKLCALQ